MSTCDSGDGIFKSFLTNVSSEHSLNTTTKGLLHSVWWYLITQSGKWSLKKYSPVSFCAIYATTYTVWLYLDQTYLVQITCEIQKLKLGLSTFSETSRSHMSQCLRNNWVPRGRHTLLHFTSQTPLRVHKTPPDVTLAGAWNKLKHHRDCCHYIGYSWYTGLHHNDCYRYAPGHHQQPSWLEYRNAGATDIILQALNKECSREVRRSTTRWFLRYQRVRFLTTITRYVTLMICKWKLAKMQDW